MSNKIDSALKELEAEIEKYKTLQKNTRFAKASEKTEFIRKSTEDVIAVGDALRTIKDEKLWKELNYSSFKEYSHLELGFSITWSNQMMSYASAAHLAKAALEYSAVWEFNLDELTTQRCLQIWVKIIRKDKCDQVVKELNRIYNKTGLEPLFQELQIAYEHVIAKEKEKAEKIAKEVGKTNSKVKPTSTQSAAETAEIYAELQDVRAKLSATEARWRPVIKLVRKYLGAELSEDAVAEFIQESFTFNQCK